MTPVTTFAGRKVALFGLGGSGLATVRALLAGGADVLAWDDSPESRARAQEQGVTVSDLRAADWSGFSALILAPGVPLTHPVPHWTVDLAKAAGIEIIGDVELFCRERATIAPDAPFIAITGTNGKSTTTALIAHILSQAGLDVQMGGNIGTAILSLEPPAAGRYHVIELSSFQIDLTPSLNPSIGVLLNITPDHLDRHGTMENYAAIKERVVDNALCAVIGWDGPLTERIAEHHRDRGDRYEFFSTRRKPGQDTGPGAFVDDGKVFLVGHGGPRGVVLLADLSGISSLRGEHNAQNAAAACASLAPLSDFSGRFEVFASAIKSFPGLPHRMEEVGRRGRVLFVNDSKATNADSTEKALTAFHDVHWILGGKAKEGGIDPLAPLFGRIAHAYLIGAASDAFAATLEGRVPYTRCGTLDVATREAARAAGLSEAPEPVVLLSPACASYDQFRSFEDRGDQFRALVRSLPG